MRTFSQVLLAGVLPIFVCANAGAVVPSNDPRAFDGIPSRNVFGLRAAQQPSVSNPPPTLPKLILQGITTILGNKRALLKEEPATQPGAKAPSKGEDLSMILTEGQRQGDVEVLQIDEKLGSVKVSNSGTVMTLTFDKDGAKLPSSPPATNPVVHPGFAGNTPRPFAPGSSPTTNIGSTPRRTPRWPMNQTTEAGASRSALPTPTANDLPAGLTPQEQAIVAEYQKNSPRPNPNPAAAGNGQFVTPPQGFVPPPALPYPQ